MSVLAQETVTRLRPTFTDPPETDRYGNEIPSSWPESDIPECLFVPREGSDEDSPTRAAIVVGATVYAPIGTDLDERDRIRARGGLFEIEGDIADWSGPFADRVGCVVANLKRVRG